MPKTKLQKRNEPKAEKLYILLVGTMAVKGRTVDELARAMKCSNQTVRNRLAEHSTDKWTKREILAAARCLDIPIEEIRAALQF